MLRPYALRQIRLQLRRESALGQRTDDALDLFSALEQDHRRDALDAVIHRRLFVLVDVELDDLELPRKLIGQLLEYGRDGAAWATPVGIKVDQNWSISLEHLLLEISVSNKIKLTHFEHSPFERLISPFNYIRPTTNAPGQT